MSPIIQLPKMAVLIIALLSLFACRKQTDLVIDEDKSYLNLAQYNEMAKDCDPSRYYDQVEAYAQRATTNNGVVFVGSSTFDYWYELETVFSEYKAINRGVAGANIKNLFAHGEKLLYKHNPFITVVYVGDNDSQNLTPSEFKEYMDVFVPNYFHRFKNSHLIFLSVKFAPARHKYWSIIAQNNAILESYSTQYPHVKYVDFATPLQKKHSWIVYQGDGLHLNDQGYKILFETLIPVVRKIYYSR